MRVAFASDDRTTLADHLAKAAVFLVYEISPTGFALEREIPRPADDDPEKSRILRLIDLLEGPDLVYAGHIGPQAVATLTRRRVHPLLAPAGTPLAELCTRLQAVLAGNPPPWLRRLTRERGADADA